MVEKIVLIGASFALTLGGTIIEISRTDKITAGEGNGKSMRFESIEDVKKVTDTIPDSSVYQLLSSSDEKARESFDLGDDFHSLTLKNRLDREYTKEREMYKFEKQGDDYVNDEFKGKKYNETDLDNNTSSYHDWPYLYSQKEFWKGGSEVEKFDNTLTSYFTENGLLLDFDIVHSLTYLDRFQTREHNIFDGIDSNYENSTYRILSKEFSESKFETILDGSIFITNGTAYLKYDRYENNYTYSKLTQKNEHYDDFDKEPKEFDDTFYAHFPDTRPSENQVIKESMEKSIKKNYGKFFDLRFKASDVEMPVIPSPEQVNSMSEKEMKKLASSYALAMITPILETYCDTTIAEMLDIGNIPMSQLSLCLDFYSEKDEQGNLLHTKKDGSIYKLEDDNKKMFSGALLESVGVFAKGQYDAKCKEALAYKVRNELENNNYNKFITEIKNSNDADAKLAVETYEQTIAHLDPDNDFTAINSAEEKLEEAIKVYLMKTRTAVYDPSRGDGGKAFFTLVEDTAPTFFTDFQSMPFDIGSGYSYQANIRDSFTIMDVDNTVIHAPKKIRRTVLDLYEGAMDEYADTMYEQYKKAKGE